MSSFEKYYLNVFKYDYANFTGRVRREAYWHFILFHILMFIFLFALGATMGRLLTDDLPWTGIWPCLIYFLVSIIPSLGLAVRRLHDSGKSGWFYFIRFIPFGRIILIVLLCLDGTPGMNKNGPNPKNLDTATTSDHLISDDW